MRLYARVPRIRTVAVASAVGLASAVVPAGQAFATPVTCGSVIVANTTLKADLACHGNGLVIGAAGITIDLGGHTLSGDGTGIGVSDGTFPGTTGFANVTVKHGRITGFPGLVTINRGNNNTLRGLRLAGPGGVGVRLSSGFTVTGVTFDNAGLSVVDSPHSVLTGSTMVRGGLIYASDSNVPEITHDGFVDSPVQISEVGNAVVTHDLFLRSPIRAYAFDNDMTFNHDAFVGADIAFDMQDKVMDTQVTHNTFAGNRIGLRIGTVEPVFAFNGVVVTDNDFRDNRAVGTLFEGTAFPATATLTFSGNSFVHNGFAPGGLVDHQGQPVADGLHIAIAPENIVTVAKNKTAHNGAFGIYAVPGTAVDGGGNTSVDNPSGCIGVTCR